MTQDEKIQRYKAVQAELDNLFLGVCKQCGKCCTVPRHSWKDKKIWKHEGRYFDLTVGENGLCPLLTEDGKCLAQGLKPMSCERYVCSDMTNHFVMTGEIEKLNALVGELTGIYAMISGIP